MQRSLPGAAVLVALVVVLSGFGAILSAVPAAQSTPTAASAHEAISPVAFRGLPRTSQTPSKQSAVTSVLSALESVNAGRNNTWFGSMTSTQETLLRSTIVWVLDTGQLPSAHVMAELGLTTDGSFQCPQETFAYYLELAGGNFFAATLEYLVAQELGSYGCEQAAAAAQVGKAYTAWAQGIMAGYGNEANLTGADFQTLASALNLTTIAWERAADHAALSQLGNSSFNIGLALFQSGVFGNLAPVPSAYQYEVASEGTAVVQALNGHGATGAVYAGVSPDVQAASTSGQTCATTGTNCMPAEAVAATTYAYGLVVNALTNGVFIPHGANMTLSCPTSCPTGTIEMQNELGNVGYNSTISTNCAGGVSYVYCPLGNFTGPTGLYNLLGSSSDIIYIPDAQVVPTAANSGISTGALMYDGPAGAAGTVQVPFGVTAGGYVALDCANSNGLPCGGGVDTPSTYDYIAQPGPVPGNIGTWITGIEWQAAQNAEAYWAFLREAGFRSAQSIPADCSIPAPYLVLPSSINESDLTVAEWESLYLATLEGMGHFYNVTLNGTSFCGTQAIRQWKWGGAPWGNLFINATGFVYLTNGTTPTNYAGHPDSSEKFSNVSTWAIGQTDLGGSTWYNGSEQLLLMPTISSITIPVGVRYEVPANNPIEIYAVQTGLDLWLNGNGSSSATQLIPLATVAPGDAIYLTSCTVGGAATSNCTLTVQTVNVTLTTITCNGPCSQGAPGGTFGGLPNPFSLLAGLFSGLFGGGPLGALPGGNVSALLILGVILVLVYVAVVEVEAWGGKKRGGSGGGGSTVVVTGGR